MHASYSHNQKINRTFEDRINFVLDCMQPAVLLETAHRIVEFTNPSFCSIFFPSFTPEELIGKNFPQLLLHFADVVMHPQPFIQNIQELSLSKQPVSGVEIAMRNGSFFNLSYKPVYTEPSVCGHLWILEDISQVKNLQGTNNSQQSFYEKVLNNIPADISIFDKNQQYLFVNSRNGEEEHVRKWMIGKNDFDYFLSQNKGLEKALQRKNYFEQAKEYLHNVQYEETKLQQDGKEQHMLQHFFPYVNDRKEIEFVISYGVNISRIRQNEKLLVKSIETYQKLIHNLDEIVFVVDSNNAIQYVNPMWERVFAQSYHESTGKQFADFFTDESSRQLLLDLNIAREQDNPGHIKGCLELPIDDESVRHYQYSLGRFFRADKEELMISVFLIDITDQVNARKELQAILDKERALSDMKTVFVNMVSHELRTPLSIIQSSAEILELLQQDNSIEPAELQSYTTRIVDEVKNLKDLMDELLLVSRIESDKINFDPSEIDIVAFVDGLVKQQYQPWKDGRSMQVETRGTSKPVSADRFMMRHILNNVIDNAFKYSLDKESPVIRIFFGHDHWSIVCKDFGIGIPENDIHELGNSFRRGSNVGEIQGTGLGLVVVRYFVTKHNGTVSYESEAGKGTVVRLSFPY
ncbi:MAG: PAS domain S-box protein [Bacteroidota bacterium]|nr:PAS domain S-box protein [Bacteroidota bacterium]